MTSALILAEGEHHAENAMTLPFADFWFGVLALTVFMALLAITWAFRNTAAKLGQGGVSDATHGSHTSPGAHS
ncbi:hypothetical protein [Arsenicicoccus sp. oral taxon 190]|uniref:hypothetical protein n=1 Tax=Arsenicicoccus sp. oral taxon 190 TaxID=1658671 RepID=UPI000679FCE8|nr:hypothetical protein [Arsenicicoccus sp. oral taxon 190]AKT51581.1 hypothetical protein ADJ73_10225 [Arsenicicoccus sp. oral taxon 190]